MTCNNEGMSGNESEGRNPTGTNLNQDARRLLMLGTRGYEITVLIGAVALAVFLAVGSLTLWSGNNWAQLLATWCGVASATVFSALLIADLFRPHLLTRKRLMQAIYLLVSFAAIAILSAIAGFFL